MLLNEIYVLKHLRLRHDLQFLIHSIVCLCILYGVHTSYFSIKLCVPTVRFQHPLCILLYLFSPSGYLPSWFPSGITRPFHRDLCDHLGIFIFFEFTFRVCITVSSSNLTSMKWQAAWVGSSALNNSIWASLFSPNGSENMIFLVSSAQFVGLY